MVMRLGSLAGPEGRWQECRQLSRLHFRPPYLRRYYRLCRRLLVHPVEPMGALVVVEWNCFELADLLHISPSSEGSLCLPSYNQHHFEFPLFFGITHL